MNQKTLKIDFPPLTPQESEEYNQLISQIEVFSNSSRLLLELYDLSQNTLKEKGINFSSGRFSLKRKNRFYQAKKIGKIKTLNLVYERPFFLYSDSLKIIYTNKDETVPRFIAIWRIMNFLNRNKEPTFSLANLVENLFSESLEDNFKLYPYQSFSGYID